MSFENLYFKRTAATAKACYVCYKPTTIVLATINTVDFLYTCANHLSDPGFASLVTDEPKSPAISAEEIARIKVEWEEKQRKKLEKEKDLKKKGKEEKDPKIGESDGQDNGSEKDSKLKQSSGKVSGSSGTSLTLPPKHDRYILHRDFFSMRQREHRNRRQAAQAKELAPRLPGAPVGGV